MLGACSILRRSCCLSNAKRVATFCTSAHATCQPRTVTAQTALLSEISAAAQCASSYCLSRFVIARKCCGRASGCRTQVAGAMARPSQRPSGPEPALTPANSREAILGFQAAPANLAPTGNGFTTPRSPQSVPRQVAPAGCWPTSPQPQGPQSALAARLKESPSPSPTRDLGRSAGTLEATCDAARHVQQCANTPAMPQPGEASFHFVQTSFYVACVIGGAVSICKAVTHPSRDTAVRAGSLTGNASTDSK